MQGSRNSLPLKFKTITETLKSIGHRIPGLEMDSDTVREQIMSYLQAPAAVLNRQFVE